MFFKAANWQKYNADAGAEIAVSPGVMSATIDRTGRLENKGWKFRSSRFGGIVAALAIADAALFSYILSGYVVTSRITIPDRRVSAMARAYDASMKPSPQVLWTPVRKQAKATMPVIDEGSVANAANLSTSAEIISVSNPENQKISTPAAVPRSEPAASLSRASKRSSTT